MSPEPVSSEVSPETLSTSIEPELVARLTAPINPRAFKSPEPESTINSTDAGAVT